MCRTRGLKLFDYFITVTVYDAEHIMILGGGSCSAPWRKFYFYFILFHFTYFINAAIIVGNGWVHLPVEQTGRPDHLSFTYNSRQLKLQKTVAR